MGAVCTFALERSQLLAETILAKVAVKIPFQLIKPFLIPRLGSMIYNDSSSVVLERLYQ